MKRTKNINLVVLFILPFQGFACDLHGEGGFDQFPSFHPFANRHLSDQYTQTLSLKHASKIMAKSGEPAAVTISYRVPVNYDNVNISFSASEPIEFLESSKAVLEKVSGNYQLKYRVSEPGTFRILIQVDASDSGKPVTLLKHINVLSS